MASLGKLKSLSRSFTTLSSAPLRICVVGSGPAGFYTAEKARQRVEVDIIDRLPTPFGLVRTGGFTSSSGNQGGAPYSAESDRCLGINGEAYDLAYSLGTKKHVFSHHICYQFDFSMDQILAYLLISASSSAATRADDWISNWGKDEFTLMATASHRLAGGRKIVCTHCDRDGHTIDRCFYIHGFPPGHRYHGKDDVKPKGKKSTNLSIASNVQTSEIKQLTTNECDQFMALLRKDIGNTESLINTSGFNYEEDDWIV